MTKTTEKINILICGPSLNAVSGISTHINQILNSTIINSYSLIHFEVGSEGHEEIIFSKVFRLITSPFLFLFSLIKNNPEIVHINSSLVPKAYWRDLVYMIIAKFMYKKIIYQNHGGALPKDFFGTSQWGQLFLKWSLELPDAIVLLTTFHKQSYALFGNFKCLVLIPNAIDLSEYNQIKAKKFDNETMVMGYLGRFAYDKGIIETIYALDKLREKGNKNFIYKIAGAGPLESKLKSLVIEKGLEKNVFFIPPIFGIEKLEFWDSTELFLFPTYHREAMPYSILEALASGAPMITTAVGGIPEIISEEKHGLFVDVKNVDMLLLAIERLLTDRELLRVMSVNSIEHSHENYGIECLAYQFIELYNSLV